MANKFLKVGTRSALAAGKMTRVEVNGMRILLANVHGRIFAADDTCSHEDASLSSGSLRGQYVKCPLHGSRFDVCTGQVMDEPAQKDLKTYAVQMDGECILLELPEI
jgi:nitrite reductase/ring-hydroxylating ferredoxin subunit